MDKKIVKVTAIFFYSIAIINILMAFWAAAQQFPTAPLLLISGCFMLILGTVVYTVRFSFRHDDPHKP